MEVIAGHRHQQTAQAFSFLKARPIDQQGIVAHDANIELASQHLVRNGGTGGIVFPDDIVLHVSVLTIFRQVFLQEFASFDDNATRVRIGTEALMANANTDGLSSIGRDFPHTQAHSDEQYGDIPSLHGSILS